MQKDDSRHRKYVKQKTEKRRKPEVPEGHGGGDKLEGDEQIYIRTGGRLNRVD